MSPSLTNQQWTSDQYPLVPLTGISVALLLIRHLVGISTHEEEIEKAKAKVGSAKVGDKLTDAYGTSYTRVR